MDIRADRAFLETILDSVGDSVFTVDHELLLTSVNKAAEQLTGVPRLEAVGQPCHQVFRASICQSNCALRETMECRRPVVQRMALVLRGDGTSVSVSISTALLQDRDGRILGGVETLRDMSAVEALRHELSGRHGIGDLVGRSPVMQRLVETLPVLAASTATVLIEGESGTGKELVARALHDLSPRRHGPFVAVSSGAIPDTLIESELFGHRAGAFTDARRDRQGRFELASGGTIFLDEVDQLSPPAQVKLLRVLQERVVEPLGAERPVPVDVRVVAATNARLSELVAQGRFREDLFYRLSVIPLGVPPLRERLDDLPLLVDRLLARLAVLHGKPVGAVSPEAMQALYAYDYPGNVRELENALAHGVALCRHGVVELGDLPRGIADRVRGVRATRVGRHLRDHERRLIEETLRRQHGHRLRTALELGIDPSTLYRKLKRLGAALPPQDGRRRVGR